MPIPILIDTDIGDDIDDALALAVALNSPEIELVGITTVFRDAPRRTLLVRELLHLWNRKDIPVCAGCSQPFLTDLQTFPHGGPNVGKQFEALDPTLKAEPTQHAALFLIDQIRAHHARGEVLTVVPIGALSNIALAFALAPETAQMCRIVMMGGKEKEADALGWGRAEWNILCDPEAAAMVFRAGCDLKMVGLDVTLQCILSEAEVAQFRGTNTPRAHFLADLIALWSHDVILHDPLTVLTLFADLVSFEPRRIEVELCGEHRAVTKPLEGAPNCLVAVDVDAERAKSLFLERVLGR